MFTPLLVLGFAKQSLAQNNSTALEGWQFADSSRSSWDILWTCLSTIIACTWTALHVPVPRRDRTEIVSNVLKVVAWICTILAPEFMAGIAAEELWQARSTVARCNAAFRVANSEPDSVNISLSEGSPVKVQSDGRWGTIQGYCVGMNGVLLQTKDDWIYPVHTRNVVPLIEAGIIKPSYLRAGNIKDRAKADSFTKGFTLLQSFWVTTNIIARRAYDLPITAIEIATVAYVACAAATYIIWWNKPKDMVTPITIYVPYDRESGNMPHQVRDILSEKVGDWVHLNALTKETEPSAWDFIVGCFYVQLAGLKIVLTPWTWKRHWKESKARLEEIVEDVRGENPQNRTSNAHQDEENSQDPKIPTETGSGGHRDEVASHGPKSEQDGNEDSKQDGTLHKGLSSASECQQPSNQPKDEELTVTELSQEKKPPMRSSNTNSNHPHTEPQKDEPTSEPQKLSDSVEDDEKLTITEWTNIAHFYMFIALVFCGIHVAAYVLPPYYVGTSFQI